MAIKNMNFTEDNTACMNDTTFEITLSVSKQTVHTKAEGEKITAFETLIIDTTDEDLLQQVFTSRNYSTNVWAGTCSNDSYIGMTGVILDFDGTLTIDEARELFYGYHHVLHTSASHQVKQPVGDRFRVILPFAPGPLRFVTAGECKRVYRRLLHLYPAADAACVDPGRKYFPHTNELGAEFILDVNSAGRYFDIEIGDVADDVCDVPADYTPPEELNTREELARMLKFDRFIRWCQEQAGKGLPEPLWYAMISNLCRFEGGRETIHAISKQDPDSGRYDPAETDAKIDHALVSSGPIGYEEIVRRGWPGAIPSTPLAPAGWAKFGRIQHRQPFGEEKVIHIRYEDDLIVKVGDKWQVTNLVHLKHDLLRQHGKLPAVCPFCDHDAAEVGTDTFHFTYIWCDRCKQRYYEHPEAPGLFAYKGELRRIEMRSDKYISPEIMKREHFRTAEEYDYVRRRVFNDPTRTFSSDDFQIRRIGSAKFETLTYELNTADNAIVFKYPPLPVKLQDNAFINAFIESIFGQYSDFIRDWMAIYANTNYVKLPVIALGGSRYAGKNTFAEMVGKIFPKLLGLWDGDVKQFNAQFTNKLLFVDENRNADKPVQYTELKRLTGNEKLAINQKFEPEYIAPNNLNIIIATNEAKPLYLKWGEEPRNGKVNNFFIIQCKEIPEDKIDRELKVKLEDRLGHYVRTELRARYEKLAMSIDPRNRYTLETPITGFAKGLYASSKTSVEEEAEILAECIVRGVRPRNALDDFGPKFTPVKHPDEGEKDCFIGPRQILNLIGKLKLKASRDMKAYTNALVRMQVISPESDHRTNKVRLGHKILRSRTEYPEEGQVVWDE